MNRNSGDHPSSQSIRVPFVPVAASIRDKNVPESEPSPISTDADPGTMDIDFPFDPIDFRRRIAELIIRDRSRFRFIPVNLMSGCYRIEFIPNSESNTYHGTMRVERGDTETTISGDLYQYPAFTRPAIPIPPRIPIFPRRSYFSYLRITDTFIGLAQVTLVAEEYEYTHPRTGFNGTFAARPTRTVRIVVNPGRPPAGFGSPYFRGTLFEDGVEKGSFTMGWVSSFFRSATVEIDTLTGAVSPRPVPARSGSGMEDFRTIFATAGWDLAVNYDETEIPVPEGVDADECWSNANLHALMVARRRATPSLDNEWRLHLVVVPAELGCARGWMYDQIVDHREGVATFSDDGYPSSSVGIDSGNANYGTAADQRQRDVPRAYLRSAAHEIGHGFNQQHPDAEGLATDNSIMSATPSVASRLGSATSGLPGVFPDDIQLSFNEHNRHHLIHAPDPVVRPGAMNWAAGHSTTEPEADIDFFDAGVMELKLLPEKTRVSLGEFLPFEWELENHSDGPIVTPADIHLEEHYTEMTVINPDGSSKRMLPFVIFDNEAGLRELKPGERIAASTRLFWSSNGFGFGKPGNHIVEVRILWNHNEKLRGVRASMEIWVDYPKNDADNEVASFLMHDQVGMFVALGGGRHLQEAVSRIERAISKHPRHPASKRLAELIGQG